MMNIEQLRWLLANLSSVMAAILEAQDKELLDGLRSASQKAEGITTDINQAVLDLSSNLSSVMTAIALAQRLLLVEVIERLDKLIEQKTSSYESEKEIHDFTEEQESPSVNEVGEKVPSHGVFILETKD